MKVDSVRLKKYLADIVRSANELKKIIEQNSLEPGTIALKAAKYILIELAEAMSNTLQHVLAKQKAARLIYELHSHIFKALMGTAVLGYCNPIITQKMGECGLP